MSDEVPSVEKVGTTIPFFFYDIIGHILPGTTLLVGLTWYFGLANLCSQSDTIRSLFSEDVSAGAAALVFLLFFGVANIAGIFLKSISYIVRKIAERRHPLSLEDLRNFLGLADINELRRRFQVCFGSVLLEQLPVDQENRREKESKMLNSASFLCSHYTMKNDLNLGLMTSRWDAEALSTQSLCFVAMCFAALPVVDLCITKLHSRHDAQWNWVWLVVWAVLSISNYYSYNYVREKRIFGRFALFLTVTSRPIRLPLRRG